jgi:hypothetical protein
MDRSSFHKLWDTARQRQNWRLKNGKSIANYFTRPKPVHQLTYSPLDFLEISANPRVKTNDLHLTIRIESTIISSLASREDVSTVCIIKRSKHSPFCRLLLLSPG